MAVARSEVRYLVSTERGVLACFMFTFPQNAYGCYGCYVHGRWSLVLYGSVCCLDIGMVVYLCIHMIRNTNTEEPMFSPPLSSPPLSHHTIAAAASAAMTTAVLGSTAASIATAAATTTFWLSPSALPAMSPTALPAASIASASFVTSTARGLRTTYGLFAGCLQRGHNFDRSNHWKRGGGMIEDERRTEERLREERKKGGRKELRRSAGRILGGQSQESLQ